MRNLEKKKYTAMEREPAMRQKITQKNKRRVKKWYQPRSKNLERWNFFCLEVNKEKVATYYHLLFIFHGQLIFCPEVVFIKGCTCSVVLIVVWFLLCVCCLRCCAPCEREELLRFPPLSLSSSRCLFWSRRSHVVSG